MGSARPCKQRGEGFLVSVEHSSRNGCTLETSPVFPRLKIKVDELQRRCHFVGDALSNEKGGSGPARGVWDGPFL